MRKSVAGFTLAGVLGIGAGLVYLLRDDSGEVKTTYARRDPLAQNAPAMVSWRDPKADMAALFPGAPVPDSSAPKVIALSSKRAQLMKSLGKETPLDSNALYVYPVAGSGAVLLRRAAGEFGAIEVVLGIENSGKVAGVRIQRHREPPEIEKILTSPKFLGSFSGKTAQSDFSKDTEKSLRAVSLAVRALLIEYDAGTRA